MNNPYDLGREIGHLLAEAVKPKAVKKIIGIWAGRFQPYHPGHHSVYQDMVRRFGRDNVFIGTSGKTDAASPLTFDEKRQVISKMFGVPSNKIIEVKSPFRPEEILKKFNPETTAVVTAFSGKDAGRLGSGGKYYRPFKPGAALEGYKDRGYFVEAPILQLNVDGRNVSGTALRDFFGNPNLKPETKKAMMKKMYGTVDVGILKLFSKKFAGGRKGSKLENIEIPVEIGDTILTGKFKNKKTVVKSIGSDEHEMPTINGRKVATFRTTNKQENTSRQRLSEGGAAGHMAHPFDDFDLTFGELKQIVEMGLEGKLNVEAPVTEKLDGQNISVSYDEKRGILFARNKGHLKDRGATALDVSGIKQMFAGRGEISNAFTFAAQDLNSAIKKLSSAQRTKIFQSGSKWVSLEIIYPATQNVIPYGHNMLIFHNTIEVDDNGNAIGVGADDGRALAGMIKQINQDVQKNFRFGGPVVVNLPRSADFSRRKAHFAGRITRLQNQYGLKDNDKVMMWHQSWWEDFIDTKASKLKYRMPNTVRQGLLRRWAFQETGAYTVATMKSDIVTQNTSKDANAHKFLDWALSFDKGGKADQFKKNIAPFEKIFLQLGAEILLNVKDLLTVAPGKAAASLRKELDSTIKDLQKANDVKKMARVTAQLAKLNAIGLDKVVPTEGIVFMFKGKLFKFTGTFAPVNQLIGLLKFG